MDNLINKVISGNASPAEVKQLNVWIEASDANKAHFDKQVQLWDLLAKANEVPEVNVELAWNKFNTLIAEKTAPQKTFMVYKLAAVFVLVLGTASLMFLFKESKELMQTKTAQKHKEKNETDPSKNQFAIQLENPVIKKSKATRYQTTQDSLIYTEIDLVDSSSAMIGPSSVLKILDHTPNQPRIASLSGAGLFDIKPSDKDFILETTDLKIKVQGTKFNINTATENNKFVEISVDEGYMEVYEKANPSNKITISSKEKYIYDVEKHVFTEQKEVKKSSWSTLMKRIFKKSH